MRQERSPIKINQMTIQGGRVPAPEIPGIDGKVIGPTKEEAADANAGKYAPKGIVKVVAEKWKVGALAAATGAAAYGAYEMNPGIHRLVDEQFLERIGVNTKEVPLTFENNKVKQLIGANNTVMLSLDDVDRQFPQITKEGDSVKFLLPIVFSEGTTGTLDKSSRARGFDPSGAESPFLKFSKPVMVIAPLDAKVAVFRASEKEGLNDPNMSSGASIEYYDPGSDMTIKLDIYGGVFRPLVEMKGDRWEYPEGTTMKKGTRLIETISADEEIGIGVMAWKGKTRISPNPHLQFHTDTDGKLVVLAASTPQENVASVK